MLKRKTRDQLSTHLSLFIARAKKLPVSELLIVRDILRFGLLIPEQNSKDRKNNTDKEFVNDIMPHLLELWIAPNALFKPPVIIQRRTIKLNIKGLWKRAVQVTLGKGNLAR